MSSEFKTGQYLEWITQLPLVNCPLDSPVFILDGNEWFFRFTRDHAWLQTSVEIKNKRKDFEPYKVRYQFGFKKEDNLSLEKGEFTISDHCEFFFYELSAFQRNVPQDYLLGNWIKFVFYFENMTEPLLKTKNESEYISPDLKLFGPDFCLESLSEDFGQMLQDGQDYDIELKCNDHTWKVHKNVLCTRSKVFKSMIHNDMIEGRSGVITLQDMDTECVQHFLKYLYCGKLPVMSTENAKLFYEIGDKYAVECLKKSCANYLASNVTPQNASELLIFATDHNDCSLKDSTINFIIAEKVFMSDHLWSDFREHHPGIACEVYERFCKAECSK